MLPNLIQYFHACYQSDFKTVTLLDFLGTKVSFPIFLNSSELLEGKLFQFPISSQWGADVEKNLTVYSKEKTLYCCSFFVTGATLVLGRKKNICAPLYLHPIRLIEENDVYYLQLDADNPTINPAVIALFQDTESGLYESLCEALPKGFIGFDALHQIIAALQTHLPLLQVNLLDDFPSLKNKKELKEYQKKAIANNNFHLVPVIGIGLLDKPSGSRGVLNELEKMVAVDDYSASLKNLWNLPGPPFTTKTPDHFAIPALLSAAQNKVLKMAHQNLLSLVIGPPGTGKSFTIAALALEFMSQGKSVLIASKNIQAVNVVANKIEKDFGLKNIVIKAGSKDYKKDIKKRLSKILNGIGVIDIEYGEVKELSSKVKSISKKIQSLEKVLHHRKALELDRGGFLSAHKPHFWNRLKKKWLAQKVAEQPAYWDLMTELERLWDQRSKALQVSIKTSFHFFLYRALLHHRAELQLLLKGLRARLGNDKEHYFDNVDFQKVLNALPIWIADTSNIHQVLPLQKELFDLVIIDEATQCDIASAMPILQRGKQAIVVGDPKQLRHLSFLSILQQKTLIEQYNLGHMPLEQLNYRENSLLDLVSENLKSQEQIQLLDEHYRSMPDIIQFSNREFYQSRLHIMTATPTTLHKQHLFLSTPDGQRTANGVNAIEADAILQKVADIMIQEAHLYPLLCQKIGILSPFRSQVNYLQKQAAERFSTHEWQRHNLLIGTPYAFQGEERDLMLLSFVLDDAAHHSAFQYLSREDVFNVSITRARAEQYAFVSFTAPKVKKSSLLGKYLAHIQTIPKMVEPAQEMPFTDVFLKEVVGIIATIGVEKIYTAYPIAGIEVDIVVVHKNKTFCIDLVGYPGAFEDALPIGRWQMLGRIGLNTFTIPYTWWVFERQRSIDALLAFID